jgi:hypothetical protein
MKPKLQIQEHQLKELMKIYPSELKIEETRIIRKTFEKSFNQLPMYYVTCAQAVDLIGIK